MRRLKLLLIAISLLILPLISKTLLAKVHKVHKIAKMGKKFSIGEVDFYWRRANGYQFYLYTPGKKIHVANVTEAPANFKKHPSIKAYKGPREEALLAMGDLDFTEIDTSKITLVATVNYFYTQGLFIFKYKNMCAAVDFLKRDNDKQELEYKYHVNDKGRCIFGLFDTKYEQFLEVMNGGVDTSVGEWLEVTNDTDFSEKKEIANLVIVNGAHAIFNKRLKITGKLYVKNGFVSFLKSASINNLHVSKNGVVKFSDDQTISLKGDLLNNGKIIESESELIVSGNKYQIIFPGSAVFHNFTIIKKESNGPESYVHLKGPLVVLNNFSAAFGNIILDDQSSFYDANFEYGSGIYPTKGAKLYFQGNVRFNYRFEHNNSTIIFNGDDDQEIINNSGVKFYNLIFDNQDGEISFTKNPNVIGDALGFDEFFKFNRVK